MKIMLNENITLKTWDKDEEHISCVVLLEKLNNFMKNVDMEENHYEF